MNPVLRPCNDFAHERIYSNRPQDSKVYSQIRRAFPVHVVFITVTVKRNFVGRIEEKAETMHAPVKERLSIAFLYASFFLFQFTPL